MGRVTAMLFSIFSYILGMVAIVGLILWIAGWYLPVTVNQGLAATQIGLHPALAAIWNAGLVLIWGCQHSIMATPAFKDRWKNMIPASIERSSYVLIVAVLTIGLMLLWQPLAFVIWDVSATIWGTALILIYLFGWVIVFISTFLINHFHLFGLQQAFENLTERQSKEMSFVTPMLYKLVRHPMMTGILIALWAAPTMTLGHLVLAIGWTVYIYFGLRNEEKTLLVDLGDQYRDYQQTTPMVIPFIKP
ncbi:methyltransferase family protein [Parasphingorhabdus sp.]|uniref:methyltransferase family protein n=1 Tax=Parasphingorhabdus sp. TaxID=2709688 RepID=UPI003001F018